jgi:ABC-type Na+ transport system ATPase subunit NatA
MDIPAWLTSDNITVATAVGALFISIYNLITSRRSEKKYAPLLDLQKHQSQLQIQEHMKALQEEKAAKFKVAYEKHGNSSKLRISNNGKCDAHNVHLFVEKNSPVINS